MSSSKEPTRRDFLAAASSAALAAAASSISAQPAPSTSDHHASDAASPYAPADLLKPASQRTFSGEYATQVAMPHRGHRRGFHLHEWLWRPAGFLHSHAARDHRDALGLQCQLARGRICHSAHQGRVSGTTKLVEGPFPPSRFSTRVCRDRACAAAVSKVFRALQNACSKANIHLEKRLQPMHRFRWK